MSDSSDNQSPDAPSKSDDGAALATRLAQEAQAAAADPAVAEDPPIPRKSIPPAGAQLIPMPRLSSRFPPPPGDGAADAAVEIPRSPGNLDATAVLGQPLPAPRSPIPPSSPPAILPGDRDPSVPPPLPASFESKRPSAPPADSPVRDGSRPSAPPVASVVPESSLPPSMPTTERLSEAAASIRPSRIIKVGVDSMPPSAPPRERVSSSRPPSEMATPPLPSFELPPPPALVVAPVAADAEDVAEITPESEEEPGPAKRPPAKPSKRPLPPSARAEKIPGVAEPPEAKAAPAQVPADETPTPLVTTAQIRTEDDTPTPIAAAVAVGAPPRDEPTKTVPEVEAASPEEEAESAPDSGEDRVSVEDAEPISAEGAPAIPPPRPQMTTLSDGTQEAPQKKPPPPPPRQAMATVDEGAQDDKAATKKPPPPPKRGKAPSLPGTEPDQAPRTEAPSQQRSKRWWEELFTEDFGRSLFPLTDKQIQREVDFIEDSLGVAKGGIVLDLACGPGRHAVELSSRGYGVVGLDLSLLQLMIAGDNAQERGQKINFLQADMRDMSFESVFDGVYCWDTSFGYFEEDKNIAVVERVFRALRPGGNFLLDVINRDFVTEQQPSQVWFEGDACVCMDDMSVDFITSRLRVKRTMMLDDGRSRELVYSIRVYSLHELGKILHGAGFRVIEASGHLAYPGTFLGGASPRVMILAQKP